MLCSVRVIQPSQPTSLEVATAKRSSHDVHSTTKYLGTIYPTELDCCANKRGMHKWGSKKVCLQWEVVSGTGH